MNHTNEVSEEGINYDSNEDSDNNLLFSCGLDEANSIISSCNVVFLVEESKVDCRPESNQGNADDCEQAAGPKSTSAGFGVSHEEGDCKSGGYDKEAS